MRADIEWHLALALPDLPPGKTVFHGHEEVRELWTLLRSAWDSITLEVERVLAERPNTVVAKARFHGRARESEIEIDRPIFYVFEVDEDNLLTRVRPFETEDEARRAAGLV